MALNEAFSNASIAIYIMYEILTTSLDLSKILCPYKAQETIPGTRSLD